MIDWQWFAAGGILVLGILLFFLFASRRKYQKELDALGPDAIKHYTKKRDELTLRNIKKIKNRVEKSNGSIHLISQVIGGALVLVVGFNVMSAVTGTICVNGTTNSTSFVSSSYGQTSNTQGLDILCNGGLNSILSIMMMLMVVGIVGSVAFQMFE